MTSLAETSLFLKCNARLAPCARNPTNQLQCKASTSQAGNKASAKQGPGSQNVRAWGKVRGGRIQSGGRGGRDACVGATSGELLGGGIAAGRLSSSKSGKKQDGVLRSWRMRVVRTLPSRGLGSGGDVFPRGETVKVTAVQTAVEEVSPALFEAAFELGTVLGSEEQKGEGKKGAKKDKAGASTVSSGVKLEHISKTYKGATILKDVTWDVKKGERVGLVGVNGAGKTTQLRIIAGKEEADAGYVVKARENMKIAFLTQEFDVVGSRTLREEFMSVFAEELTISARMESVQVGCIFYINFASSGGRQDCVLIFSTSIQIDLCIHFARKYKKRSHTAEQMSAVVSIDFNSL